MYKGYERRNIGYFKKQKCLWIFNTCGVYYAKQSSTLEKILELYGKMI